MSPFREDDMLRTVWLTEGEAEVLSALLDREQGFVRSVGVIAPGLDDLAERFRRLLADFTAERGRREASRGGVR